MKVRAGFLVLVLALLQTPALAATPAQPAGLSPHLAGTLPAVEEQLQHVLRAAGLAGPLVHIAADTNGHKTVAWLAFAYDGRAPDPLPALQAYAWSLIRTVFTVGTPLDELDLSGFGHEIGPFDPARAEVTFSAAVSRDGFLRLPSQLTARHALALLPRVWYAAVPQPVGQPLASQYRVENRGRGGIVWGKVHRGSPSSPAVALTFDDGPFPIYTTLLLDTLRRLNVQATFFLVGERVEQYPFFAQAIVKAGHEVGNHTFHHMNLTHLTAPAVADELIQAEDVIARVTGITPRYFRPPGGDYDRTVLRTAGSLGLVTVFWTDDPADYKDLGPRVLEARLLARVSDGGILLLHQGVSDTIHILPVVDAVLHREGFAVTTVGGLVTS